MMKDIFTTLKDDVNSQWRSWMKAKGIPKVWVIILSPWTIYCLTLTLGQSEGQCIRCCAETWKTTEMAIISSSFQQGFHLSSRYALLWLRKWKLPEILLDTVLALFEDSWLGDTFPCAALRTTAVPGKSTICRYLTLLKIKHTHKNRQKYNLWENTDRKYILRTSVCFWKLSWGMNC